MTSEQISEARFAFFGCVYRNAQTSPAEIGRMHCRNVIDLKALTTDVVTLMESAFTVAMAESKDLRIRLDALEAEKYALEDQVKGLQELMRESSKPVAYRFKERHDDMRSAWLYTEKLMRVPPGHPYQALCRVTVADGKARDV